MINPKVTKNAIAFITKGRSGGMNELIQILHKKKEAAIFFADTDFLNFLKSTDLYKSKNFKSFGKVIISPFEAMVSPTAFLEIFSENCRDTQPANVICCYDYLGPSMCTILKNIYRKESEASAFMRCYNKVLMREIFNNEFKDDFKFHAIYLKDKIENLNRKIEISKSIPWILKPAFGTSSELVSPPLYSWKELEIHLNYIKNNKRCYLVSERKVDFFAKFRQI